MSFRVQPPTTRPGRWTWRQRRTTAAYLILLAIVTVSTAVAISTPEAMRQVILSTPQGQALPKADIAQLATADAKTAVGVACLLAIWYVLAALGAYRGWRWAYWAALVLVALEALSALPGLLEVLHPGNSSTPEAIRILDLLLAVAGLCIFGWLMAGLFRRHPDRGPFPFAPGQD